MPAPFVKEPIFDQLLIVNIEKIDGGHITLRPQLKHKVECLTLSS